MNTCTWFQPTPTYDSVGDGLVTMMEKIEAMFQPTPTYDSVGDLRSRRASLARFQPTPTYDSVGDGVGVLLLEGGPVSTHAHL